MVERESLRLGRSTRQLGPRRVWLSLSTTRSPLRSARGPPFPQAGKEALRLLVLLDLDRLGLELQARGLQLRHRFAGRGLQAGEDVVGRGVAGQDARGRQLGVEVGAGALVLQLAGGAEL